MNFFSKKKELFRLLKFTNFSNHSFFLFLNCLIASESKNSFAINILGKFLILSILEVQIILCFDNFFFCILISKGLFSCIIKLQDFNNCGKLLKLSIIIFINSPFPEPSSIKLNFFGDPRLCQYPTIQIAIISEKSLEILGAVVKSPFSPNGFFFM